MGSYRDYFAELKKTVKEATPQEVQELLQGDVQVADFREKTEWDEGHLAGAAFGPKSYLEQGAEDRLPSKDKPTILYCAGGVRSVMAADALRKLGYTNVISMTGGYNRWKDAGLPWTKPETLAPEQAQRYSRHLLIPEIGERGQLNLLNSKALLIGAGGLRAPARPSPPAPGGAPGARAVVRGGRRAGRAAGHHRLDPGERSDQAAPRDRRAARRPLHAVRRARRDVPRGQASARSGLPGLQRPSDDHRVHRLRGLLRVALGVAGAARVRGSPSRRPLTGILRTVGRALVILITCVLAMAACTAAPDAAASPSAQKTGDFKQSKLDIAYSFMSDASVHNPTSKQLLEGALNGMKKEAKSSGGSDDVAMPEFSTDQNTNLTDFRKFAAAAGAPAVKNPQLSADRFATPGITGLIQADPDCHTYYLDGKGGVINSRSETPKGAAPQVPSGGTFLQ